MIVEINAAATAVMESLRVPSGDRADLAAFFSLALSHSLQMHYALWTLSGVMFAIWAPCLQA